jgi:four helix bundle protein
MQDFHNLVVWQKAYAWVLYVYKLTKRFPDDERFGVTSQLRRAAASIPANLAEACGRGGKLEFGRFVQIALGSAAEAEYHVLLAKDLGYLKLEEFDAVGTAVVEIKRMLASLLKSARSRNAEQSKTSTTEN